jgi:hypothetical protein
MASVVIGLLAVQIVLMVVEAVALSHRIGLLHRVQAGVYVSQAQGEDADNALGAVTSIGVLVFIATVVVWCLWQHRAQRNVVELTAGGLGFTPGWAVGWWFIPLANLVKPFQAVRELWKASHGGDTWRHTSTWPVIGLWWAFWLVGNIHLWFGSNEFGFGFGVGNIGGPTTLSALISHDTWEIVSLGLRATAAILAIVIVRSVVGLQEAAEPSPRPAAPDDVPALPAPPMPR